MSNGFVHSVKVPRIYKFTADIVRRVREDNDSLKTLIYEKKHPNVSGIYGLSVNTLQALPILDQLLSRTKILIEQPRLDPWLARVLITELLWGKRCLKNNSKPVLTLLTYEHKLHEEARKLGCVDIPTAYRKKVQRPRYVRVNTLLLSVEEAISLFQEEGWQLLSQSPTYSSYLQSLSRLSEPYFIQDLHIPEILVFPPSTSFHDHPGYQNGKLILQDKASCLAVHLLNPTNGSMVLDMCAAPGMKATYIAAKLQNNGKIYAVEIDAKRFGTLCNLIEKTQSSCVEPINQDALTLDSKQYSQVEYILVDPSCSGSGIVDRPKQSDMDGKPEQERLQNLQSFQVYLLRYALFNFPNAKRIIYSTCSIHPEENEQVIDEVLADVGKAYRLVSAREMLGNNWINFSSEEYNCTNKCLYSRPDVDFCNGFFVAVFERDFDVILPRCNRKGGNSIDFNLDIDKNDEKESCKRKKHDKKKNNSEISVADEQTENFEVSKMEVKNEIKVKRSRKEINVCVPSDGHHREMSSKLQDIQEDTSEGMEWKKLTKKKKRKRENVSQINDDEQTMKAHDYDEQNEKIKIKLPKKREKEESEQINIDETNVQKNKQNEVHESESQRKKKKKKHMEKMSIIVDKEA